MGPGVREPRREHGCLKSPPTRPDLGGNRAAERSRARGSDAARLLRRARSTDAPRLRRPGGRRRQGRGRERRLARRRPVLGVVAVRGSPHPAEGDATPARPRRWPSRFACGDPHRAAAWVRRACSTCPSRIRWAGTRRRTAPARRTNGTGSCTPTSSHRSSMPRSASSWSATSCSPRRNATSPPSRPPSGSDPRSRVGRNGRRSAARPAQIVQALVFRGPGSMPLEDRPDPEPQPGEVVVAVRASGICGSDVHGFGGATGRRRIGVVMGHEAAGDVIAVGPDVTTVALGDRIVLRSILSCGRCDRCLHGQPNICLDRQGMGMHFDGAYAERIVVSERLVVPLPDALSYEDGSLVEPLAVAMHALSITAVRGRRRRRHRRRRPDRAPGPPCGSPAWRWLDPHHRP